MSTYRFLTQYRPGDPCPSCGARLKPVMYGMPAGDPGPDVLIGGCIFDDASPSIACGNCDWGNVEAVSGDLW